MLSEKKVQTVSKYKEKLTNSKSVVLTDYRGLTNQQMETLRKALTKVGTDFIVVKNTLLTQALKNTDYQAMMTDLPIINPTATLFIKNDIIPSLKELTKFIDQYNLPNIKIGFFEGEVLDQKRLLQLAKLPTKDILFAQVVAGLKNPQARLIFTLRFNLQKLMMVLKMIEKKRN